MKHNLKTIISLGVFCFSIFISAQFNTLTYSAPIEKEKPQNIFDKKENIKDKKEEKKENKKYRKIKLFGGTTKVELKKDIDSLKEIILKMGERDKKQTITDSILKNTQQKTIKPQSYIVKKFDFISDPQIISKISMPLDKMIITSPFGFRTHPIFGGRKMHNGIDLVANYENVYSVLDGVVSEAGWDINGGGNYIKIRHSNRFETAYLHLSHIYYKKGEEVKAGYIIGKSGNSGNSTGPHLHFAVKEFGGFVNPTQFLNDLIKVNNLISIQYEQQQFTNR